MKKLLTILAVMVCFSGVAQAGVLIEPYLGYEMGKTKNSDGKLDGSHLGLRLAYTLPVFFWVGVDGTLGVSATAKPDAGSNEDVKRTSLYAVAGVDFPILVRAWVGYGFSNQLKFETSGKFEGKSTKVGVGFTGLPFISLNLEYINETFDKLDGNSLGTDFKNDTYVLSVSLPLEF